MNVLGRKSVNIDESWVINISTTQVKIYRAIEIIWFFRSVKQTGELT
jgi:hypothetical protein